MREKKGHYIIIKGLYHQEDIIISNIYVPNNETSNYIKKITTDLKEEIYNNGVI